MRVLANFSSASSSRRWQTARNFSSSMADCCLPVESLNSFFCRTLSLAVATASVRSRTWCVQCVCCSPSSHTSVRCNSDSASPRATFAPSANFHSAARNDRSTSIESTRTMSAMGAPGENGQPKT